MALADVLRERVSRRGRTAEVACGLLGTVTVEALPPRECAALGLRDGGRALLYAACRDLQTAGETLRREGRLFTPAEVTAYVSDEEAAAAARTVLALSGVTADGDGASTKSAEVRLGDVQNSGAHLAVEAPSEKEIRLDGVQENTGQKAEVRLSDVRNDAPHFAAKAPSAREFRLGDVQENGDLTGKVRHEDARESAVLQGELLVDAYQENPGSLDLNEDGTVGYVMLEGERSHQDSLIRTEWSVQTMRDGDIPLEKLTGGSANWDRSQAAALMEQWIRQFGDAIEVVICNNDEMALGAAEALERAGDTRGVKVVGIDGTPQGIEGLKSGKLYGTVQCDSDEYAEVIFEIAAAEALGQNVQEKVELEDGTYYQCSQKALTVADLP